MSLDAELFESCPECDSLDVSYRYVRQDQHYRDIYQGFCRECGADWEEGFPDDD